MQGEFFQSIKDKVDRHESDLYYGNGRPGLTTRTALLEENVLKMEEKQEQTTKRMDEKQEQTIEKVDRLSWLVAIGIGVVITLQFLLKH